jgi:hypothetical protein
VDSGLYTISQIARGTGITRSAVHAGLARIGAAGQEAGDSRPAASVWRFDALPLDWQLEITRRGVKRGFANGEDFLSKLPEPWKCPLPWDQVPEKQRDKAVKLQKALARALAMRGNGSAAAAQGEQAGLEDFKAEFSYPVSGRHWRRLFHRTIERDAGEENWQRLEIYLDGRAFAAPSAKREAVRNEFRHRELDEVIAALENRQQPTLADREYLWNDVFHHYERETEQLADSLEGSRERRLFKASLAHYLFKAFPERTLCATEASLRRRFDEKLDSWRQKGRTPEALEDRRPLKSGKFRKVEFPKDLKAIRDRAILHDGNIALAYRLLHEEGKLSKEFCEFYPFDVRTAKSEVPAAVRAAVAPLVEMCLPLRRGPWQARMRGPYIPRDWSAVKPGDWFCADDVTWNHYFKVRLADGRWQITRGECLLITDLRTGYPLEFLLIPGKYNGEHVRNLVLRVHDRVGLPRCGFYFEKGVWASRLVTGDNRQGTPVHWREAENGLCSQGMNLEVRHATTPRAKPIEGLLRILQERMRCIPGFVGFNEREYDAERMQALIDRAHRGDEAALGHFPTMAVWRDQVSAVLSDFAQDTQNGKMVEALSPAAAWAAEIRQRPLKQLTIEARYKVSTHQKIVTVRQEGIVLTIRGNRLLYYNEHTGPLIGQEVSARYNLEMPELLTVCDMKRQNYFSVGRIELPAVSATKEQFEEVNRVRKGHMAHAKGIFGDIAHEVVSTITRDNDHSEEDKELGRFHNEEMAQAKAKDTERGRKMRKLQVKAATAGIELTGAVRNPDDAMEAIDRRAHFLQAMREDEERSEAGSQAKETKL